MPPDSGNPTDNPSDFSYWFNNPDDADVLLQLSTSLEANGQQEQQLSVSTVVDEEQQQQQQQQLSMSAAVDGRVSAAVAAVDGEQQQQQQLSVSAAVDGEQQQRQQLSVSAAVDREQQQQQQQHQQQLSVPAAVDGEQQQQQQQQHARSFHAHAIILRQRSAYFRSSLTNDWQQANQPRRIGDHEADSSVLAAAGVRYELVEPVEANELDAMEELLRLMYSQKVPEGAAAEVLLQMLRLADRYQSVTCTQLLLAHLASGGKDAITLSVAAQLFSMPASVQMHPAFKSLSCICSDVVVEHYSDVSAVIQSDELCQHFCKLPYAAVLAWAGSGQLRVHSENCVVYLLSAWVKAQQQQGTQGISAEQLEQLAHQVRVLQLGPAYQYFVLPHLEWFKGCSGMEHFHLLLAYKGVASTGIPVFPSPAKCGTNGNVSVAWEWAGPAAWVAGPRQLLPDVPRSLRWDLRPEEVQQMHKLEDGLESAVLRTPHLYANGFQLRLRVTRELKEPGQGATLGSFFYVSHQMMSLHGVPWPQIASVSISKLDFKVIAEAGSCLRSQCGVLQLGQDPEHNQTPGLGFYQCAEAFSPHA